MSFFIVLKIKINKQGRDGYEYFENYLQNFEIYLKGIDNIKSIEDYNFSNFTHHLCRNSILRELKVKDYKKYLPNIKYFIERGHLCASLCGNECKYCYKCAAKIQKKFKKKQKEQSKRTLPFCFIK